MDESMGAPINGWIVNKKVIKSIAFSALIKLNIK